LEQRSAQALRTKGFWQPLKLSVQAEASDLGHEANFGTEAGGRHSSVPSARISVSPAITPQRISDTISRSAASTRGRKTSRRRGERRCTKAVYKKGKNWYIDYYVRGRRKRKKVGPASVNREITCIKHMFTKAIE
jgi:hypothetical protein